MENDAQVIFLNLFTTCSLCKWKFAVYEETNENYLFANGSWCAVKIIAAFCFEIRQNKNSFHYVLAVEITIVYIFIVTSPREIHQLVFILISSVKSRVECKKCVLNSF